MPSDPHTHTKVIIHKMPYRSYNDLYFVLCKTASFNLSNDRSNCIQELTLPRNEHPLIDYGSGPCRATKQEGNTASVVSYKLDFIVKVIRKMACESDLYHISIITNK